MRRRQFLALKCGSGKRKKSLLSWCLWKRLTRWRWALMRRAETLKQEEE